MGTSGQYRGRPSEDLFGLRVRQLREDRGWTQADLASKLADLGLKLHPSAIAKIEDRDAETPRAIRLSEAEVIARAFGTTVDEMLAAEQLVIRRLHNATVNTSRLLADIRDKTFDTLVALQALDSLVREAEGVGVPSTALSVEVAKETLARTPDEFLEGGRMLYSRWLAGDVDDVPFREGDRVSLDNGQVGEITGVLGSGAATALVIRVGRKTVAVPPGHVRRLQSQDVVDSRLEELRRGAGD